MPESRRVRGAFSPVLEPNPLPCSAAQACYTNFMPEVLREGGGRLGKDGSVARRLVPWIPLVWKLQLCFNDGSKAQEK